MTTGDLDLWNMVTKNMYDSESVLDICAKNEVDPTTCLMVTVRYTHTNRGPTTIIA